MKGRPEKKIRKGFAPRLLRLIETRGLKQITIARAVGVGSATISKWCLGSGEPGLDNLVRLADFLEVSLDFLLRGVAQPASLEDLSRRVTLLEQTLFSERI